MFLFRTTLRSTPGVSVDLAFTDRYGGVSASPYDELNLSVSGDDEEAAKAENHRLLVEEFAPEAADDGRRYGTWGFFDVHQVHGAAVDVVDDRRSTHRPEADGIVAAQPEIALMVRAADCVPVLLADPGNGVVGAAHAGRLGLQLGVVAETVAVMRARGAEELQAWIGPHICGACYEVPQEMQDEVATVVPAARATTSWGTPSLDLGAGVRSQLEALGVAVTSVEGCTRERADLFSYRRDGAAAGRQAGIIVLHHALAEPVETIAELEK